jgi:hypothetical protein
MALQHGNTVSCHRLGSRCAVPDSAVDVGEPAAGLESSEDLAGWCVVFVLAESAVMELRRDVT